MTPKQAILAAKDLQANALMPAHVGVSQSQIILGMSHLNALPITVKILSLTYLPPIIVQPIWLDGREKHFTHWWKQE